MIVPRKVRVERLVTDYGAADHEEFLQIMQKVTKKLGGQNYNLAKEKLMVGDMAGTIDILLNAYYDKAYLESIRKKQERVISEIDWDGKNIQAFAKALTGTFETALNKTA